MIWYYLVAIVLVVLSIFETNTQRGPKYAGLISAIILSVFAGLRFETGYDWLEYENYFRYAPTLLHMDNILLSASEVGLEPGFFLLNVVIKTLGLSYQFLFLAISAFDMFVMYFLLKRFTPRIALVFLWYYGITFLGGQMAAIRQCLGISFIFLALMQKENGKNVAAMVLCGLSVCFHAFSAVFIPLVFLRVQPPRFSTVAIICAVGFLIPLVGFSLFPLIAREIAPFAPASTAERLLVYSNTEATSLNVTSIFLTLWHLLCLFLILRKTPFKLGGLLKEVRGRPLRPGEAPPMEKLDQFYLFTVYATIMNIVAHTYLSAVPVFWNRVMLVTFVLQPALLTKLYAPLLRFTVNKVAVCAVTFAGAIAGLSYALLGEKSLPYVPYQSAIVAWYTGDFGDGRQRYIEQMTRSAEDLRELKLP